MYADAITDSMRRAIDETNRRDVYKRQVMNALNQIRVQKAKRFLRYTASQISQIGRMCGFESASYFAKEFRKRTGVSPSEYRTGFGREKGRG